MKKNTSFRKINKGNYKGWLEGGILDYLPEAFFQNPISYIEKKGGKVIKSSKLRWVAIFEGPCGQKIFLKRDLVKGWFNYIKYLILPTKAQKEWLITYQMGKKNLPVPKTFGWMEKPNRVFMKESYYFSQAINNGISLIENQNILKNELTPTQLAIMLRKFHLAGLFHKDLHAGNLIGNGESIYLTDLHRAKIIRSLSLDQKLWNLSQLFYSLKFIWGEKEQNKLIDKYFENDPIYKQKKDEIFKKIYFFMDQIQEKHWRSRGKRCLSESTEFSIYKKKGFFCCHRKDFPLIEINRVVKEHMMIDKEKPYELIKKGDKISISLIKNGKNKICVKQYQYKNLFNSIKELFRQSKAMKAWVGGNILKVRGVNAIQPLAVIENREKFVIKSAFYIMEAIEPSQELNKYISRGFIDIHEKRKFIKNFARWLFEFHQKKLYHRDMKATNILVLKKNGTWDFFLIDTEDIVVNKKLTEGKLLKNFIQLNTSIPKMLTNTDRIRFINEYLRLNPIVKDKKNFIKKLEDESSKRFEGQGV